MKTITLNERSRDRCLHVEAPGVIVNITINLTDSAGRRVTSIEIIADGDRYAGEPPWWLGGQPGYNAQHVRVIEAGG